MQQLIAKLKDEQRKVYFWDPSTMDYFGEIPVMSAEEVKAIVDSARVAQEKWKSSTFQTRKLLMRTMQRYVTENKEFCGTYLSNYYSSPLLHVVFIFCFPPNTTTYSTGCCEGIWKDGYRRPHWRDFGDL